MSIDVMQQRKNLDEAVSTIKGLSSITPQIGLILGSGLGVLATQIENPTRIAYQDIPHFPTSTVEGHEGCLVLGTLAGKPVVAMQGRFHLYEGYSANAVTFPIRVLKGLGVKIALITNAAGGVNESFQAGDLMLIQDHINLMFQNPLIGPNDPEMGVRFPDMSNAYDSDLGEIALQVAKHQGLDLKKGVYAGMLGPSYETPAEIKMIRRVGGDAVGMSTVPEVIVARHAGIRILGISCISNMAAGILDQPLSHEEVVETGEKVKHKFSELIHGILTKLSL